jgi:lysophospholipase L1-like esterase
MAGGGIPKDPVLNTVELVNALAPTEKPRRYRLYLPLYNGLQAPRIGVALPHTVRASSPSEALPIAVYGTSIVQGAVASRPGMAYTAQLGRMLDKPVINLGFSGQCQMEPEIVDVLVQITTDTYVIDCLPNMHVENVQSRAIALIRRLHEAKPAARIVLVEHFAYEDAHLRPQRDWIYKKRNTELRRSFEAMAPLMGDRLALVPSSTLLAADGSTDGSNDATTDGIHPNDMGMNRIAKALAVRLR